jgi:hypothetical protein
MNQACPKCGKKMLAREDNFVICCIPSCDWKIEAKRAEDMFLAKFAERKKDYT